MAMAKVNISIPDGLLDEVDALAAELKRSRSGIVQEATAEYVARVRREQAEEQRQHDISRAVEGMAELAVELEAFDGTATIRKDRDRDGRGRGAR